jgi:hypothetical protein
MAKMLDPSETELTGVWVVAGSSVQGDETCNRIDWLVSNHLRRLAGGNWVTLYVDPLDGRFWELSYPHSAMHGGGPPRLSVIDLSLAKQKYGIPQVS